MFDLYLITAELPAGELLARASAALTDAPRGRVALQLRARHLAAADLRALAHDLRALTRARGAPLLINGSLELALEVGADGAQLPERGPSPQHARAVLPAESLIGASRHDLAGLHQAAHGGATFIVLGPVFAVPDKSAPLGVEGFGAIARTSSLPVIALGGIGAARVPEVIAAGAHGIAVIRDVFASDDPRRAVAQLLAAVDAGRAAHPVR
jgi:thiamine-phosphate pyrophosphorylase